MPLRSPNVTHQPSLPTPAHRLYRPSAFFRRSPVASRSAGRGQILLDYSKQSLSLTAFSRYLSLPPHRKSCVGMFAAIGRTSQTAVSRLGRFPTITQKSRSLAMAPVRKRKSSAKAPKYWVPEGYREDLSKGAMLRFEDSLPRLPVPTLEETSARYLKSIHPLLTKDEYAASEKAVAEFQKEGGLGQTLQKRLLARRDDPKHKSWIYEWWNDVAYLSCRDPVVPYVSYFYSFRDDRRRRNPAKRAAAITTAALEFKRQVDERSLEPEYMRTLPMSIITYEFMFNTSRVAAEPADYPIQFDPKENQHIVVIRKNQFFKISTHVDGKQLNTSELELQFSKVYQNAQQAAPIGSITSLPRDQGTVARANLLAASPSNAEALRAIESASFIVCLDNATPVTLEERARQYWHGDGNNRWYDKPLQFIVNDNGTAGFMGEHSMMDGTPTHRLCDTVNAYIVNNRLDFDNPSVRSSLPDPRVVRFDTNAKVLEDIASAQRQFAATIAAQIGRAHV